MINILFASSGTLGLSSVAKYFASKKLDRNQYSIFSVNTEDQVKINDSIIKVMQELDVSLTKQKRLSEIPFKSIDLLVSITPWSKDPEILFLAGYPTRITLKVKDSIISGVDKSVNIDEYRLIRDEIHKLVDNICDENYLSALIDATNTTRFILNSLGEGIIAHDINRRITFFNKAAEEITGYKGEEAIGRDCHDVFPGNFCGLKCAFCTCVPDFDTSKYNTDVFTKSGAKKSIEMSVTGIRGKEKKMIGVLASFRDRTIEADMENRLKKVQGFSGIIGKDPKMLEVFDLIRSVADSKAPVLIYGASGTGKELVASAIHNESYRAKQRFITVNCGAIPETLLESELFGHKKGAFTGAVRDKKGRFELADKGTIFLDEIGDITPAMQVKLLRVLQEGTFEKVGGEETIKVDVRIISATNKDLQEEILAGRFREDLYYRLSVVPVNLPSLRERKGDIPLLTRYLLKKILDFENKEENVEITSDAMAIMMEYDWPGNIREMQNWLQFALIKAGKSNKILPEHFPVSGQNISRTNFSSLKSIVPKKKKLTENSVREALVKTKGNKLKAARLLGVGRATLYRFLDSL